MLPVALEIQADATQMQFETLRAAIASLLDKEGKIAREFRATLDKMRTSKGKDKDTGDPAEDLLRSLSVGLGMPIPSSKKKGK